LTLTIWLLIDFYGSTSTYVQNFTQIEKTFCGQTDGRTNGHRDWLYYDESEELT